MKLEIMSIVLTYMANVKFIVIYGWCSILNQNGEQTALVNHSNIMKSGVRFMDIFLLIYILLPCITDAYIVTTGSLLLIYPV